MSAPIHRLKPKASHFRMYSMKVLKDSLILRMLFRFCFTTIDWFSAEEKKWILLENDWKIWFSEYLYPFLFQKSKLQQQINTNDVSEWLSMC